MNEQEGKAAIRILGAVARADKRIDDREREALKQALADFQTPLPDGATVESLVSEEVDLDAQIALVTSPVARRAVFESAIAMSLVDGVASAEENEVIARLRKAFSLEQSESLLHRTFDRAYLGGVEPILDPEARRERAENIRATRAIWAGVFGAMPFPFIGQFGVIVMFDSVVQDIAVLYGHNLTRKERWARFGALLSFALAQGALRELLKLVPGWGTVAGVVGGALFGFTSTYALGRAVQHHFEEGGKTSPEELKKVFQSAREEGKKVYEEKKAEIDERVLSNKAEVEALTKKLEAGEITSDEFNARVAELSKS